MLAADLFPQQQPEYAVDADTVFLAWCDGALSG